MSGPRALLPLLVAIVGWGCSGSSTEPAPEAGGGLPTWDAVASDLDARIEFQGKSRPDPVLVLHEDGSRCFKTWSAFPELRKGKHYYRVNDCTAKPCGTEVQCPDFATDIYTYWLESRGGAAADTDADSDTDDGVEHIPVIPVPISTRKPQGDTDASKPPTDEVAPSGDGTASGDGKAPTDGAAPTDQAPTDGQAPGE